MVTAYVASTGLYLHLLTNRINTVCCALFVHIVYNQTSAHTKLLLNFFVANVLMHEIICCEA